MVLSASRIRKNGVGLLAAASGVALAVGLSQPADAQQIVPGNDPECTITAGEAVCEGDLAIGIVGTPSTPDFSSITVRNATGPIAPPGYAGIIVVKDNGDVSVNVADDVVIQTYDDPGITGSAQGLVVQNTNGFGITIDSGAAIITGGNGQAAAALEAAILAGGGTIDVTNRGDLSLSTSAQLANGLIAQQFSGNGDILIDNSGDIATVSGSTGERVQPAAGILAYSYEGGGLIDVFNSGSISITTDPGNFDTDFNGIAGGIVTNAIGGPSVTRIANNAAIIASGPQTHGIVGYASSNDTATGVSVSIANGGAISTDGTGAYGMLAQAAGGRANLAVNNSSSGTITMANADGDTGIYALNEARFGALSVTNAAAISASGFDAVSRAIGLSTAGAADPGEYSFVVDNSGNLSLSTILARGITVYATSDDDATADVTNSGNITLIDATYDASAGISVDLEGAGAGATLGMGTVHIDNSGAIALGSGNAVYAAGDDVRLVNSGTLSTTGDATNTVYLRTVYDPAGSSTGAGVTTTGDIMAEGAGSSAIYIDSGHTANVTVSSGATVSALDGTVIRIDAPSTTTVNVAGSIAAASADDVAIALPTSSSSVIVNLTNGFGITGKVLAPGANDWLSIDSATNDLNNPYLWDLDLLGTQFQGFEHLNFTTSNSPPGYAVRLSGSVSMNEIRFNRQHPDTSYVILDGASLTSGVAMVMPKVYGNGTLSAASMDFVSPGLDSAPFGTITTGDLTLKQYAVNVGASGQTDLIVVNGAVTLDNAGLTISESGTFTGSDPFHYLILDNDGADAVNGTFTSIDNMFAFLTPTVSYTGGDGNDIILTLTPNNVTPTSGCSPASAPSGASVTCTGTDSDGFTDGGTNLSVTVVHGAVVTNTAAEPTATAAFALKSDSALVNHGTIIMDYPVQEQIEAIHFGARGRLTNASDGVIEVNAADLSHAVLMGDGGVITNQGIIRGTLSGNDFNGDDKGLYLYNGTSLTNEQGGLIDLKLLPTPGAAGPRLTGIYSVIFDGQTTGNMITNAGTIRMVGPDAEGALIGIESTDEPTGDTILNTETGLLDLTGTYLTGVTVRAATNLRNDGTIALHMTYPAGTLADPVRALLGQAIEADWLEITDPVKTIVNTGTITVDGSAATGALLGHQILLQNRGTIYTDGGGYVETQSLKYPNFQLYGSPGIFITGAGSAVDNSGTIEAVGEGSSAIQIGNPLREEARGDPIEPNPTTVINTGLIRGAGNGILAYGETDDSVFTIVNQQGATIKGTGATGTGISGNAGVVDLDNAGTIAGAGGTAIALGDFADTVHLRATSVVNGDVLLGGGADQLRADEGTTLNGTVYLGEGDDAIDLATLAYDIAVDGGAGTDTARYVGDGVSTRATLDLNSFNFANVEVFQQGPTSAGEIPAITVNADGSDFSRYDILSGSLAMDGANSGLAVRIGAAGTLKGTGTVGAVVSTGGAIAPGNSIGVLTVNGDLALDAASIFKVEVDDAGNSDLLVVNGGVSLGGSTLDVVESGAFAGSDPFNYLILDNDGTDAIDGTFGTIHNGYAFLHASVSYTAGDGNDIGLTLTPTSGTGLFPAVASTFNQLNSATRLDELDRSDSDANTIYMTVLFTTTPQALAAFGAASGEVYATQLADQSEAGLARDHRLLTRAIQQASEGWGLWGGVKGRTGSIDGDSNAARAGRGAYGSELGVDYRGPGNGWALGAQVGWTLEGHLDVDGRASQANYDGWDVGGYVRYGNGRAGPTVSAALSYGEAKTKVTRGIAIGSLARTAQGHADYQTFSIAGDARYGLGQEGDNWAYGPLVSVHFASTDMGGVAETGAGALNLSGSGARHKVTRYGGGLFAGWQSTHGAVDVSAQYVTGKTGFGEASFALDGAPGTVRPVRSPVIKAGAAYLAASGRIDLSDNCTLSVQSRALIASGNSDLAGGISFGWRF